MSQTVSSRSISEHLCTLAGLLEAEAIRMHALKMAQSRDLFRQAGEVRALASGLWNADMPLPLAKPVKDDSEACARPGQPQPPDARAGLVLHTNDALERMAS